MELPLLQPAPMLLQQLLDYREGVHATKFRDNIRGYNSIFALTSSGGHIDHAINNGICPYVFRINGQNHHRIGSLLPATDEQPKFAQLYIYDTENEVHDRMKALSGQPSLNNLDENIIKDLLAMFDDSNQLVRVFRIVRDRFRENQYRPLRIKLIGGCSRDSRQYNLLTVVEVVALIVGDFGVSERNKDVIIKHKCHGLRRIIELHPSFMAMQYPILFPYAEDGYHTKIPIRNILRRRQPKRETVSIHE